ncbi:MAG: hypothetical protein KAI43_09020 [Candidatus Aureabacteria bacterium]|nr:hypothetical protein [Candidatus Auribacterota bacterium]
MKVTRFLLFLYILFILTDSIYAYDNVTSSEALVARAATCLEARDWKGLKYYTQRCISLYQSQARNMQRKLKDFASLETTDKYWALNDVAYSYFLQGEMYRIIGKTEKAKKKYMTVIKKFKFAQVYDPSISGAWQVAEACEIKLNDMGIDIEEKNDPKSKFIKKKLKPLK